MKRTFNFILLIISLLVLACTPDGKKKNNSLKASWEEEFPGVWITRVGHPEAFDLLSVSNKEPRKEVLNQKSRMEFPLAKEEIKTRLEDGKLYLRFPLEKEEQIYGFGLNFKSVQQRGRILRLHVDHFGGKDNGRTHAPVPFFVSSKGYGVLVNSARYLDVYVGTGVRSDSKNPPEVIDRNTGQGWKAQPYSDNLEILVPAEGVELLLLAGDNMLDVVERFNLYCGGGVLPPKWGLGFWQRTPTLYSSEDVKKEIKEFEKYDFPLDVIGLEPGWHSKAYPCTFMWDSVRFPEPAHFVEDLQESGIKVNLWMNPYVWPEGELYDELKGYAGSHTVWNGIVPDYTMDQPRQIMQAHMQKYQLDMGVSGYKMDEVDGYDSWLWPDVTVFPSGTPAEQMRQTYGTQMMSLTDEMFRKMNTRTYGLIRAANAGSVAYPYVIYNDYYNHRDFITALISSGYSGLLWTPEVRASRTAEEWLRRMQTTCFSPMAMINAWADGTKPWSYEEVYEECREVAFLRMQLLPYLYSTFAKYYFEGTPPFRGMHLEEGFDVKDEVEEVAFDGTSNPYAEAVRREVKDQYMMGEFLLVAPLFDMERERKVILPKGNWYNFYTGEYAGNGEVIEVVSDNNQIPLFVKDGGIIPMIPAIRRTTEWNDNLPLELRVYGSAPGEFALYDDDGSTFNYEKGDYVIRTLKVEDGRGEVTEVHASDSWSYGEMNWRFMTP